MLRKTVLRYGGGCSRLLLQPAKARHQNFNVVVATGVRTMSGSPNDSVKSTTIINGDVSTTATSGAGIDEALLDASVAIATAPEMTMNPKFLVMQGIDYVHTVADLPYWSSIIVVSVAVRALLLPIAIKTVQNGARMAVMRPEMQKIQNAMTSDPNIEDTRVKMKYQTEMKNLFLKHKVNPLRSMMMPLFQLPIFISFFMALRDMGSYFPGITSGGDFWFPDLSAADPFMVLPVTNAITFLAMIELGSDGLQTSQKETFKWAMRGVAVAMVPLTMSMPQGLFIYWNVNNILSLVQTFIVNRESVRQYLDIPKPPKEEETPDLKIRNPVSSIWKAIQKERSQDENAAAEIVDGSRPPPPPPPVVPPKTFATPPRKPKSEKIK